MLATSLAAGPLMGGAPGGRRGGGRARASGVAAATVDAAGVRCGRAAARGGGPVAVGPLADDAALEQPAPLGTHGGGVAEELLVHDLGEAGVGRLEHVRIHWSHPDEGVWQR